MSLTEKLKVLRKKSRWSINELVGFTGIPQPTLWRLENGSIQQPRADTLIALAKAFKVPVDYLIQEDYQLKSEDLLNADSDIRDIVDIYSTLPDQDKRLIKQFAQSLVETKPDNKTKRSNVVIPVKPRRIIQE